MTTDEGSPRVRLSGIAKRFGAVHAIEHADLTVMPGRAHALVGENGAGKSTLIKILSGAEVADKGFLEINGELVSHGSTAEAIASGISTVYQEPQLFAELTVAENIFIGREQTQGIRVDWKSQAVKVVELLELIGLPARYAHRQVSTLSIASRQQVAIAKALAHEASVLILDEPSAILTDTEIEVLFGLVRRLKERGVSIIYISHRLDELFRIADDITIMRDGRTISTHEMSEMTVRSIAQEMVGELEIGTKVVRDLSDQEPVLELVNLGNAADFSDVSLRIAPGEVVALYGLVGSGASEIASAVWGMLPTNKGKIFIDGNAVSPRSPRDAQRLGLAVLPADRKGQGMFPFQPISFNISAGHIPLLTRLGIWFDRKKEGVIAREMIARLAVRTPSEKQPIAALSGGNAQKVVLARQLVERPKVLVLVEPTQGVDVGAKEEIHSIIEELASDGVGILIATTDLSEAQRTADRIIVVRGGRTTVEFSPTVSQVELLAAAAGEESEMAS